MADMLSIYNFALTSLETTTLASLSDSNGGEAKRLLDRNWNAAVAAILEKSTWNFAIRVVKIEPDPDITTSFGYEFAFTKPEDWVRTDRVAVDEDFRTAGRRYIDQSGWWYADYPVIYVRYVSSSNDYGLNVGRWTQAFADALALDLAFRISPKVTTSAEVRERVRRDAMKALTTAIALDSSNQPQDTLPTSSWVQSRRRRSAYMGANE